MGGTKKVCGGRWCAQRHVSKMKLYKCSSALTIPRPWSGGSNAIRLEIAFAIGG